MWVWLGATCVLRSVCVVWLGATCVRRSVRGSGWDLRVYEDLYVGLVGSYVCTELCTWVWLGATCVLRSVRGSGWELRAY